MTAVEHEMAPIDPDVLVSRQLVALGDFVHDNLQFFLDFGGAAPANGFLPPIDRTAWARPRRTDRHRPMGARSG